MNAAALSLFVGVPLLAVLAFAGRAAVAPSSRQRVLAVALAEHARVNAPGAPPVDPARYWAVAAPGEAVGRALDWCGGFYLWALKQAGLGRGLRWRFDGSGLGGALPPTRDPKPGDLAYFDRAQHHAMVERVDGSQVHIINGNGGGKGITRTVVPRSSVAGFFSLAPLLAQEAVAA